MSKPEQSISDRNAFLLAIFVIFIMIGSIYVNVNIVNERVADAESLADALQRWADIDADTITYLKESIKEYEELTFNIQKLSFPMIQLEEDQSFLELKDIIRDNVQLQYDLAKKTTQMQDLKVEHDRRMHDAEDAYIELWMEHRELISLVVEVGISYNSTAGN